MWQSSRGIQAVAKIQAFYVKTNRGLISPIYFVEDFNIFRQNLPIPYPPLNFGSTIADKIVNYNFEEAVSL